MESVMETVMEPRKSPCDKRQYRVVTLHNGLVALLIQDQHLKNSNPKDSKTRKKKKRGKRKIHSFVEDVDSSSDGYGIGRKTDETIGITTDATSEEDSITDETSEGRTDEDEDSDDIMTDEDETSEDMADETIVDNVSEDTKMEVSKSNRNLDTDDLTSACALCVKVGSFSDPLDIPGLAHLLEHMVFMGSKKYPGENAFDMLTSRHGGYDDASTDYEKTVFTFSIHNRHLREGLDMFAHFFASPQLLEESLNREIEAVDSEFQTSIQRDSVRLEQLLNNMAKPDHPYSQFPWGNTVSLRDSLKENKINLCERLREFYHRLYSAHYMTLAIISSDPFDVLEQWIKESFSAIPNNSLPCPDFSTEYPPFDEVTFNKLIKAVPVEDTQEIHMQWFLPPLHKYYRTKPLCYLGWLLGHEGEGSIMHYLRKMNLATYIEAGNSGSGYEYNSCFNLFTCSITLTDKGFANIEQCVQVVFQYLKMLQDLGPQERIFHEIKIIEDNQFNFIDENEPDDYVERICESMQLYPVEDYLTGDDLLMDYDPKCIAMVTNLLTPDRVNVIWLSKSFSSECDLKEKWFGIKYSIHDIPEEWTNQSLEVNATLHLPPENPYIPTDFSLLEASSEGDFPVLIEQNDHYKLWYKGDNQFASPNAWICLMFQTPLHMESAENSVLMDAFELLFTYDVSALVYTAAVANLECGMEITCRGISLIVDGFSHKLHMLFKNLIDHFVNFDATDMEDKFLMMKEELKRRYHNALLKPKKLCKMSRLKILEHQSWHVLDKVDVIEHITLTALMDLVKRLRRNMFVEALVQGNLSQMAARDLMTYVAESFRFDLRSPSTDMIPRTMQLPSNTEISYCIKNRDHDSPNTVLTDYYQCCMYTDRDAAILELILAFLTEPCFDILRTKQQLGYAVYCKFHGTHGVLGLSLTLVTQTDKHSVASASNSMDKFIKESSHLVEALKKSEFQAQVNSLIQGKLEPDFSLEKEVLRNWSEIILNKHRFNRHLVSAELLKNITQEEVCIWLRRYTCPGDNYRKLSIKVISDCTKEDGVVSKARLTADYRSVSTVNLVQSDLKKFKEALFIYPSLYYI